MQIKTFSEFIIEARSKGSYVPIRPLKRKTASALAAFKKSKFRANRDDVERVDDDNRTYSDTSHPHHNVDIDTDRNQATHAMWNLPKSGPSRSSKRVLYLKALKRQLGGTRTRKPVHNIEIGDKYWNTKNSSHQLVSRGKSFFNAIKSTPDYLKRAGAKPGDKVAAAPAETMLNTTETQRNQGAKKRADIYQRSSRNRFSKMDPKTKSMIGTMRH